MNALILGATTGLGRAISEALARRGDGLLLAATDPRDLDAQANHLRLKYNVNVKTVAADASCPKDCVDNLIAAAANLGEISGLFFPLGTSSVEDTGRLSLVAARRLIDVNLVTVIAVISDFLPKMISSSKGYIVGFGSVAAVRGRRRNMVYSAAKRGLASYFESLRHLSVGSQIRVQYYTLGYIATQQTFAHKLFFPPASPNAIADTVVRDLDKFCGARYLPRYWAIIARIVSLTPWFVFKRLDF